jgi:hypothetical protein
VSEDVQGRLSDALISDLGLDNVGRINVVIAGFSRKSYRSGEFSAANCREHCNTKTGDAADEIG